MSILEQASSITAQLHSIGMSESFQTIEVPDRLAQQASAWGLVDRDVIGRIRLSKLAVSLLA